MNERVCAYSTNEPIRVYFKVYFGHCSDFIGKCVDNLLKELILNNKLFDWFELDKFKIGKKLV